MITVFTNPNPKQIFDRNLKGSGACKRSSRHRVALYSKAPHDRYGNLAVCSLNDKIPRLQIQNVKST